LSTPLRSATVLSLVLAAFSSLRFVVRKRTTSSWPSSSGPGDQRAVSRDLIVFDRLRIRHDGGVEYGLVVDLARDRVGFLDQAVDRRTVGRLGASTALARDHALRAATTAALFA